MLAARQSDELAQTRRRASPGVPLRPALLQAVMTASAPGRRLAQQDAQQRRTAASCSSHGSEKAWPLEQTRPIVVQPEQRVQPGAALVMALTKTAQGQPSSLRLAPTSQQAQAQRTAADCSDRASGPIPDAGRAGSSARTTGRRRRVRSSTWVDHYAHTRGRQGRIRPWASAPRKQRPDPTPTPRRWCPAATPPGAWRGPDRRHALRCWSAPDPAG